MKRTNHFWKHTKPAKAAACALLLVVFAALTGCGKKEIYTGGSNYPYEIEVKSNGSMKVTLDGSYSPEHIWNCTPETLIYPETDEEGYLTDPVVIEPPVSVKQKGKEKNHKAVFTVKPLTASDQFSLAFTREGANREETEVVYNSAGLPEETWEDVSARVTLSLTIKPDEKGKLKIMFGGADAQEMTGVVEMAKDSAYPFRYQVNEKQEFLLELPNLCDWEYELCNATETGEEIKTEEPSQETDQDEEDVLLQEDSGTIDYSDIDDPALLEELRELDAQVSSLKRDYTGRNALGTYNMIPEPGQDPAWYQNQDLHIWRKGSNVSEDLETVRLKLFGKSEGYSRLTIQSKLVNMKISFLLGCDAYGNVLVQDASYEGGATAVEGVMSYENEDRTQDPEALAMEEGEVEGDTSEEGRLKAQKAREAAEAAEAAKANASEEEKSADTQE
ncbi:MAG: hypothetical protein K6E18_09085 [Lachnospiraceae bacterium]|nr:hypothetical protein [Lachnospiraceae bacterium]